jgi:predicted Zn-dependent protease with MMP-like domain
MRRCSANRFDRIVQGAIDRLPAEFRRHLDNVLISVQRRPSAELLAEMGYPPDEPLLGVFTGIPLPDRSPIDPPLYPDTIFLFQEPLEDFCRTETELVEEIEITLAHEIGHYLGLDEDTLAELGYE